MKQGCISYYLFLAVVFTTTITIHAQVQVESCLPCLENYQPFDESINLLEVRVNFRSRVHTLSQIGEIEEALDYICRAAASGIAEAELFLGVLCYEGGDSISIEVEQDEQQARYWLEKSASKNNTEAKLLLSKMLLAALGGPMDVQKGTELLYEAAVDGNAEAQFLLATEYYLGRFIKKDINESIRWAKLAKQNGYEKAGNFLEGLKRK